MTEKTVKNLEEVISWTKGYFKSFDNHEANFYDDYIDANVHLQAGNFEPTIGLENLKAIFESIHEPLETIRHNLLGIYITNEDASADYVITSDIVIDYKLKNGKELSIPAAAIFKIKNFKVIEHKGFMDGAPLMEAMQA